MIACSGHAHCGSDILTDTCCKDNDIYFHDILQEITRTLLTENNLIINNLTSQ